MQCWNTSSPNHPPCRWRSASFALPAVGIAALLARLAPSFVLGSSLLARATPQTRGPGKGSQMSKNMERKQNLCCQSRMWCFFLTGRYIAYKCARSIYVSRVREGVYKGLPLEAGPLCAPLPCERTRTTTARLRRCQIRGCSRENRARLKNHFGGERIHRQSRTALLDQQRFATVPRRRECRLAHRTQRPVEDLLPTTGYFRKEQQGSEATKGEKGHGIPASFFLRSRTKS